MARCHPPNLTGRTTPGEKKVFNRLRELDDSWVVLPRLPFLWQNRRRRTYDGESDFVLLHPKHGMLIIEVKDALFRVGNRQWFRLAHDGTETEDRSPFEQASGNKFKLTNHLRDGGVRQVPIGHCVLFSNGRPSGNLGPDAPREIVLTLASLDDPGQAVMSTIRHWQLPGWQRLEDFDRAVEILSPDVLVAETLDFDLDLAMSELSRLTDEQINLTSRQFDAVRATSSEPRSLILGAAGTGKTLIAFQYARQLAADRKQVAVVGSHQQLRLLTRRKLNAQGVISGDPYDVLHSLYPTVAVENQLGGTVWEAIINLTEEFGPALDALFVDEAQSMDPDVLSALHELVRPGGQVVICGDPYQRDSTGAWMPDGYQSGFWLTENCRNVVPIGRLVARISGDPRPVSGADGRRPIHVHASTDRYEVAARAVSADLEFVAPDDVVVLTRTEAAAVRAQRELHHAKVHSSRGLRDGCVAVCTVDEFRGCESKSVTYIAEPVTEETRTTDYIAVSRACAHLRVIADAAEWADVAHLLDHGDQ